MRQPIEHVDEPERLDATLSIAVTFKSLLTRAGAKVPARAIHGANACLNYLETGRWMEARGFRVGERLADRSEIYAIVANDVGDDAVLYLEFGVHRGGSMRMWSGLLTDEGARLIGFDSFEGLPEGWNIDGPRGTFSTQGALPDIADDRVSFVKGWFDETVPTFEVPAHERLVLHLDADLYSSTKTVLEGLEEHIVPGTYILFDEFTDRWHELRAFEEFLDSHPRHRYRLVAATQTLARVAFERVA